MNARYLAIVRDPSVIPGVHHFCDEWCQYCPVTNRCLGFRCTADYRRQRGRLPNDPTFTCAEEAIAFTRELAVVDGSPTEDLDAILANRGCGTGLETADPLAAIAWEYAVAVAIRFTAAAMAVISDAPRRGGPVPLEIVLWYHLRIYMKLVRALISRERAHQGSHRLEDANGCAKLALSGIGRSKTALAVLRASEDEIEPLINCLDVIERGIHERLPDARRYLRVGLDCPAV